MRVEVNYYHLLTSRETSVKMCVNIPCLNLRPIKPCLLKFPQL